MFRDQRRYCYHFIAFVSLSFSQPSSHAILGRIFFFFFAPYASVCAKSACGLFKKKKLIFSQFVFLLEKLSAHPPKWMPHCCLPWRICFSKRIKRICCKRAAQRLKHHHCRYLHAVHPFQISVINSIYRQHRWHRILVKRTIITLLPISWIHWISIHLRIYCERFVRFFFIRSFICSFVCLSVCDLNTQILCVCLCVREKERETRKQSKSDRVYLIVCRNVYLIGQEQRVKWDEFGFCCEIAQIRQ